MLKEFNFLKPLNHVRWLLMGICLIAVSFVNVQAQVGSTPISSSYLGGTASSDFVASTEIQSDGTIIMAANINSANPGNVTPVLLNGATSSSSGAILRLSADGRTVLSVTRLANEVKDLSLDGTGNMYVAARTAGLIKLNSSASSIIWSRANGGSCDRVDSAPNGYAVALKGSFSDAGGWEAVGAGTVYVYDASGNELSNFPGYSRTHDVCIDSQTQSVFLIGYQNKNSPYNPVQVCFIDSRNYSGVRKWKSYDWSGSQVDSPNENNMADTRGLRISMGADGYLYGLFMSAGGNHIFRRDPFDLSKAVSIAGGDKYHEFYNSKSEHKTFLGKYNPSNGAYILGQQFCARLTTGEANTAWCQKGNIKADASGRVYISGSCGSGGGSNNTTDGLPYTFDPVPSGEYGGGPFVLVMSPDFKSRLFCGRVSSGGYMHTIAGRVINGSVNMVFGGYFNTPTLYTKNAIQGSNGGGGVDGMFTVVLGTPTGNVQPSVSITSPVSGVTLTPPANINIAASASDSDGTISKVEFFNGSSLLGSDLSGPYSFSWSNVGIGSYTLTAKATDNGGAFTTSSPVNITVANSSSSSTTTGGAISASKATQPASLSLSTEGTADWSHWGLNSASDWNHKSGISAQISNITKVGGGTTSRYTDGTMTVNWSGGTPTASHAGTRTGLFVAGVGNGFQITVPADATERVLKVYCGVWKSTGKLEATLSDGSAPALVDTSHGSTTGSLNTTFTINYKAGSAGQSLTVRWTVATSHDTTGNGTVGFQAATLSSAGVADPCAGNTAPTVSISFPASGATYTAPASITINAAANDSTGTISKVEFFNGSSLLGSDPSSPYSIVWNNVGAGVYSLTARATDSCSATTTSSAVSVTVNSSSSTTTTPPSGSLSATKGTQPTSLSLNVEGSRDWSHWGLNSSTDWNHKSGVTAQITNIIKVGTGTVSRYTDGTMAVSWTGGTPTTSASSTRAGIFVAGVNNGFQITVPADTTARTLRVYCGVWKSQGKLEATLSDGSAPAIVDTTHGSTTGSSNTMFTINYQAASAGQTLTMKWTVQTSHDTAGGGTVGWQAATLQ